MTHSIIPVGSKECNAANPFCIGSINEMSPVGLIFMCSKVYGRSCMLLLLPFLLRFFDVVFNHELAPQRNLLADKITQHFGVASHNLNALCF